MAAQANEWRALIEHSPIPLALVDRGGRIERANEALVRLLDRPAADIVGQPAVDVLSNDPDDGPLATILHEVVADRTGTGEHRLIRRDGSVAEIRSVATGIAGRDGSVLRTVLQLIDITEANRLERQAASSRDALERFASRAAHDLRSPLSTIAGFANLIESGALDGSTLSEIVARIRSSATRASGQVQALLDHAKTVAHSALVDVDLRQVRSWLEELLATELMSTSGSIDLDTDTPHLLVDEVPFRQILHNLCTNSMKYARPSVPPRIVLRAKIEEDIAHIAIEDNGRGVTADHLDRLFLDGFQAAVDSPGIGMGLGTVRSLVDGLGGTITAERLQPHGLRMTLTLPGQRRDPGVTRQEALASSAPAPIA